MILRRLFLASNATGDDQGENEEDGSEVPRHGAMRGDCFWVIWQAGHQVPVLEDHVRGKIKRMILGNPKAPDIVLQEWAEAADANTAEAVRQRIYEATRKARESGVEVKWSDEKSLSIIIANPKHRDSSVTCPPFLVQS